MAKYIYPAIFTPEESGYFIDFPDLDSCFTQGEDILGGMNMAEDVLSLMLMHFENKHQKIPAPSAINDLPIEDGAFATYISCDSNTYRCFMNNTAVKKTLSIPSWLNDAAVDAELNFSQILQDALKSQLHLN